MTDILKALWKSPDLRLGDYFLIPATVSHHYLLPPKPQMACVEKILRIIANITVQIVCSPVSAIGCLTKAGEAVHVVWCNASFQSSIFADIDKRGDDPFEARYGQPHPPAIQTIGQATNCTQNPHTEVKNNLSIVFSKANHLFVRVIAALVLVEKTAVVLTEQPKPLLNTYSIVIVISHKKIDASAVS